jgi:hypothetical protein
MFALINSTHPLLNDFYWIYGQELNNMVQYAFPRLHNASNVDLELES